MGLFDKLFAKRPKPSGKYEGIYQMLNGYTPSFTTWGGSLYESELIRAVIDSIATQTSKLKVEINGTARPALQNKLKHGPNSFQTWSQFLYRLRTIYEIHNNAFVCPVYNEYGEVSGLYTPLPQMCELISYNDVPYLRYTFGNGDHAAIELKYCGILTKHQYQNDFFGDDNHVLFPTMELIHIQNQGIQEGVKNAASHRFMARIGNFTKAEDLKKEASRFNEDNFAKEGGGLLLFPNTYTDIRQIDAKPWIVDADQMNIIKANVFDYFGINEDILQNKAYGDSWSAFYEGKIESWALQYSEVVTRMLFTLREQSSGNKVIVTSNRLQYLSNAEKLDVSSQMLDRGIMSINDVREIWNLPPVDGGDVRIIRGEYYNADEKVTEVENNEG